MDEQNNLQPNESAKSLKNIWMIVVSIIITALVVGGGVYAWQRSNLNSTEQSLQQQISVLQSQVNEFQQIAQPVVSSPETTQQPIQPIVSQPVCGKLAQFKNESWANNLDALYKSNFLKPQGLDGPEKDLWPGEVTMAGELSSCKLKDIFIFIPEFFEFGCGRILKYDIKNNKLVETVVRSPVACAHRFEEITDAYIEYFGGMSGGGQETNFHGRYFFNEDRIEEIK